MGRRDGTRRPTEPQPCNDGGQTYGVEMLAGTIRSNESRTITVEGDSLAAVQAALAAQTPQGWELVAAPVQMRKGSTMIDADGTITRRDLVREIEGADTAVLQAQVPDGWQLISVRAL